MKKINIFLVILFMQLSSPGQKAVPTSMLQTDTIPQVCAYFSKEDAAIFNPFTTRLSTIFPDPNAYETYTGCHFQFFTKDEYPQALIC